MKRMDAKKETPLMMNLAEMISELEARGTAGLAYCLIPRRDGKRLSLKHAKEILAAIQAQGLDVIDLSSFRAVGKKC
jgi:hypothetical protein